MKNELRLGNILDYYGTSVIVLELLRNDDAEFGYFTDNSIGFKRKLTEKHSPNPIPLTEEWLLKFGFVFEEEHSLLKGLTLNINDWVQFYSDNQDNYDCCTLYLGLRDIDEDFINQRTIKYVHELQNLYFALTQKELTL